MEEVLRVLLVEDNPAEAFLLQESVAQVDHPPAILHAGRLDQAIEFLRDRLGPQDVVLVKGSHGMRMDRIVTALEAES